MDIRFVAESHHLLLPTMLVVMLQKLKEVTCKRSVKKLAKVRAFMAVFGALASEVYAFENVDCMRTAICCSVTTSMKNLTLSSG